MSIGKGANACMVLNSYHQGCIYEQISEEGPPHKKEYVFGVTVLGDKYLGKGRSKKEAKQAAAANALNTVYHLRLSLGDGAAGKSWCHVSLPADDDSVARLFSFYVAM